MAAPRLPPRWGVCGGIVGGPFWPRLMVFSWLLGSALESHLLMDERLMSGLEERRVSDGRPSGPVAQEIAFEAPCRA